MLLLSPSICLTLLAAAAFSQSNTKLSSSGIMDAEALSIGQCVIPKLLPLLYNALASGKAYILNLFVPFVRAIF